MEAPHKLDTLARLAATGEPNRLRGLVALSRLVDPPAQRDARPSRRQRRKSKHGAFAPSMTLEHLLSLPPSERPFFVVSDGMGRDSTAMLIGLRRLGVVPDAILHADTGDEHPLTNAYRRYRQAWLRSIGFPEFELVKRAPSVSGVTGLAYATLGEKCVANHTLPSLAFGGKHGCSTEWKIVPQEQHLAHDPRAQRTWHRGLRVVKAIGYDFGPLDSRRAHHLTADDKYEYLYPLREWGWDRPRVVAEIRHEGVRMPRKSSCVFCPASKPWEIAEIVRDYPEIAEQIVTMEDISQPYLRGIEGLWGRTVKGMRGAIPKPGSMALFIRRCQEDPVYLERYLAMAPEEEVYAGRDVGQVPVFRSAPQSKRRLPLAAPEGARLARVA
jgi:hypothetical protein